jgi:hypothetical protein
MGRIEKLDNERWKGWDWAASNKLNEVIEAVNTITEEVNRLKDLQEDDNYRLESNTEKEK